MKTLQRRLSKLEVKADRPNLRWKHLTGTPFPDWSEHDQNVFRAEVMKSGPKTRDGMFEILSDDDLAYMIERLQQQVDAYAQGSPDNT